LLRAGAPASFGEGACRKVQKKAMSLNPSQLPQIMTDS